MSCRLMDVSYHLIIFHSNQGRSGHGTTPDFNGKHNVILFLMSIKTTKGLVDSVHHSVTHYTRLFCPFDFVA